MDWLEFTSKTIGELVWPGLAVYVAVTQKDGIKALLARTSKLKAGGMEAEFSAKNESTAAKVEVLEAKPVEAPKLDAKSLEPNPGAIEGDRKVSGVPAVAPPIPNLTHLFFRNYFEENQHQRESRLRDERLRASGQIIEEWANLEDTIRHLAASHGIAKSGLLTSVLAQLQKLGVLSSQTVAIVKELSSLRNQVAHSRFEPTKEAGDQYADSCWKIEKRIGEEEAAWQTEAKKLVDESLAELGAKD